MSWLFARADETRALDADWPDAPLPDDDGADWLPRDPAPVWMDWVLGLVLLGMLWWCLYCWLRIAGIVA